MQPKPKFLEKIKKNGKNQLKNLLTKSVDNSVNKLCKKD